MRGTMMLPMTEISLYLLILITKEIISKATNKLLHC